MLKYLTSRNYLLQVQFLIIFVHTIQLQFQPNCNFPKPIAALLSLNAGLFTYMFSSFYIQTYKKRPSASTTPSNNNNTESSSPETKEIKAEQSQLKQELQKGKVYKLSQNSYFLETKQFQKDQQRREIIFTKYVSHFLNGFFCGKYKEIEQNHPRRRAKENSWKATEYYLDILLLISR